jgi:hypothetical protein
MRSRAQSLRRGRAGSMIPSLAAFTKVPVRNAG